MGSLYSERGRVVLTLGLMAACLNGCASKPNAFMEVEAEDGIPLVDGNETLFQSETKDQVDILFVDDNSPSMVEEQFSLGTKFPNLIQELTDVDWQLGITTTDISSKGVKGQLIPFSAGTGTALTFLKKSTPDAATLFSKNISRPESDECWKDSKKCPSSIAKPLHAARLNFQQSTAGFHRPKSDTAVIIISDGDEDNTSMDETGKPVPLATPESIRNDYKSLLGSEKVLTVYSIVIQPNDIKCLEEQQKQVFNEVRFGLLLFEATEKTGGIASSVCEVDYAKSLTEIGRRVRETLSSLEMKRAPVPRTVKITLTPQQSVSWSVVGRRLLFSKPLVKGTRVDVEYRYKPTHQLESAHQLE